MQQESLIANEEVKRNIIDQADIQVHRYTKYFLLIDNSFLNFTERQS